MEALVESGMTVKKTALTEEFPIEAFLERYGEDTVLLFTIKGNELEVLGSDTKPPRKGVSVVALVHEPDIFANHYDRPAITLAGHTHGGQVALPLLGRPVVPSDFGQRFAAGHVVEDGNHLFVTTGVGTSIYPVRFGVPPEIALLTLRH